MLKKNINRLLITLGALIGLLSAVMVAHQLFLINGSGFTWQEAISECYFRGGYFGIYESSVNMGSAGPTCKSVIGGQPIYLFE